MVLSGRVERMPRAAKTSEAEPSWDSGLGGRAAQTGCLTRRWSSDPTTSFGRSASSSGLLWPSIICVPVA